MARLFLVAGGALLLMLAAAPPAGAAAAAAYTQEALDDEVTSLPGLNYKPNFRHFSGYLNVGGGPGGVNTTEGEGARYMHYQFFESENTPETDPVVLWTNGGPGCSGLLGLYTGAWFGGRGLGVCVSKIYSPRPPLDLPPSPLRLSSSSYFTTMHPTNPSNHPPTHSEQGPFRPDAQGLLSENPFRWNRLASMLFIEAPCGVGFSYAEDPADLKTGDAKTARDNYRLITQFLARFPQYQPNPFIISSESYGGCVRVCWGAVWVVWCGVVWCRVVLGEECRWLIGRLIDRSIDGRPLC
jgi:hypothetical protein